MSLDSLRAELMHAAVPLADRKAVFFKTGPGDYAEHDQFLGVPTPRLRQLAKAYRMLTLDDVINLLQSPINDERLLALFMLVERYQKSDPSSQENIYDLYQTYIKHVNNWNLVDASAHLIIGAHLHRRDKKLLLSLVDSDSLWEKRIAIVATWYFIRQNEYEWTIKLSEILLNDRHDLMHKAVGWMLREAGKRDEVVLTRFLEQHSKKMPRTMLRYAIEKLSIERRADYLAR